MSAPRITRENALLAVAALSTPTEATIAAHITRQEEPKTAAKVVVRTFLRDTTDEGVTSLSQSGVYALTELGKKALLDREAALRAEADAIAKALNRA